MTTYLVVHVLVVVGTVHPLALRAGQNCLLAHTSAKELDVPAATLVPEFTPGVQRSLDLREVKDDERIPSCRGRVVNVWLDPNRLEVFCISSVSDLNLAGMRYESAEYQVISDHESLQGLLPTFFPNMPLVG